MKKKEISEEKEVMTYEEMEGYSETVMHYIEQEFEYLTNIAKLFDDDDDDIKNRKIDESIWKLLDPHIGVSMHNILVYLKNKVIMLNQMKKEKLPAVQYLDMMYIALECDSALGDIEYALNQSIKKHAADTEKDTEEIWLEKIDEQLKAFDTFKQEDDVKEKIGFAIVIRRTLLTIIQKVDDIYQYFIKEIISIAENNEYDSNELYEPIVEYIREYAKSIEQDEYKDLKRMVMKMKKNRSDVLGREHWSKMLELEEKAMKLASKGRLAESIDEDLEYIDYYDRIMMDKNSSVTKTGTVLD